MPAHRGVFRAQVAFVSILSIRDRKQGARVRSFLLMIANFKMYRSAVYRASLIFCALSTVKITSGEESSLYLDEIRSLSELPMKKLIQIKSSLTGENGNFLQILR